MRRGPLALAVAVIALAVVVAAVALRPPTDVAAPSPSPTATTSPTPSRASSPTAAATSSPSPTPQGVYMNKKLGFALELPPPWRKAICGNFGPEDFPSIAETLEAFTSAGPMEESIGHVGSAWDRVTVSHSPLQGRTLRQVADVIAGGSGAPIKEVTVGGRPGLEVETASGDQFFQFIGDGDRYYRVGYQAFRPSSAPPADVATMKRIVRSFRFLSAAERQAVPDPTPIPAAAPTPQALAALLKTALEGKDVAALERLLGPCVSIGAQQAGVSSSTRERYIAHLRAQFAAGLTVMVDATAIKTEESFYGTTVRSRWNAVPAGEVTLPPSPGPQSYDVELVLGRTSGGYFWRGTLVTIRPPG